MTYDDDDDDNDDDDANKDQHKTVSGGRVGHSPTLSDDGRNTRKRGFDRRRGAGGGHLQATTQRARH